MRSDSNKLYCEVDMSATARAMKAELKRLERRLKEVKGVMDANPLGRIIEVRQEAQSILEKHQGDHLKIIELIAPLADEEKKMLALLKKQMKPHWIDERLKLETERHQLINGLFCAEREEI